MEKGIKIWKLYLAIQLAFERLQISFVLFCLNRKLFYLKVPPLSCLPANEGFYIFQVLANITAIVLGSWGNIVNDAMLEN